MVTDSRRRDASAEGILPSRDDETNPGVDSEVSELKTRCSCRREEERMLDLGRRGGKGVREKRTSKMSSQPERVTNELSSEGQPSEAIDSCFVVLPLGWV